MNWAFAVIGFIVGGIAALIGDFSAGSGSLLGAAVGFCIGHALRQRKQQNQRAAADAFAISAPPPPLPLAERVARLEATVDTLTRELDVLRAQLAGAKAGAATAGDIAQTASAGASAAPLPAHVPATPTPRPVTARADTPASTSTPAPAVTPAPATAARTA
ncbi:DUF2339 domain-containing protein, partial [Burkholderia cenocepacia]|nr:DUF2339 domain-containing protein [Burkholderia cenocepacia]